MKIVINGPTDLAEVPGLSDVSGEVDFVCASDQDRLAEVLPEADILLGWNFQSQDLNGLWHKAKSLKWIHWCGASVDRIMCPELTASNITLTNARGIFDLVMAEYALGYMLSELKLFRQTWELQEERHWETRLTGRLAGSNAIIFGVGSIGRRTAKLLRAVGVNVVGVGRSGRENDPDFGTIYTFEQAAPSLRQADWVIGLLPMTTETILYYNSKFFDGMKPDSRFLNLGRGESVDEDALIAALQHTRIAGAMLDVFNNEPLDPDRPIWAAPNIVISPHTSSYYAEYEEDIAHQFLDNLARFRRDEELVNVVDKSVGFVPSDR